MWAVGSYNSTLQHEVAARDESIELLQQQMQRQQEEYSRQLMELQTKHRREMADKEAEHRCATKVNSIRRNTNGNSEPRKRASKW